MPRFLATTTALAAFLGAALPGHAEVSLNPQVVKNQGESRAKRMPLMQALLEKELAAGLSDSELRCLDGAPRPCADDVSLMTPAGVAVQAGKNGEFILAPPQMQPFNVENGVPTLRRGSDLEGQAKPMLDAAQRRAAELTGAHIPSAAAVAFGTEEDEAEAAKKEKAPAAEKEAPPKDNLAAALFATGEDKADKAKIVELPSEAEPKPKKADKPAKKAASKEDELAAALAKTRAEDEKAKPAASKPIRQDSHADAEHRVQLRFAEQFQKERATSMPELNKILQAEIKQGLTADDLVCADRSPRPCGEDVSLLSPKGVAAEVTEQGKIILGRPVQQVNRIDESGNLVPRQRVTEAAKEAAESTAPKAQALEGNAKGETSSEKVTEDSTRSSSEDFETKLSDALAKAGGEKADKASVSKDDSNDLAKGALVGLAALAVGQMLGNREVALNTGDRVVVTREDGSQQVLKDDNALLRQAGNDVQTERFTDGSSRSVVTRPDGSQIITIRADDLTVLRRVHVGPDGKETVLIDESVEVAPVDVANLPAAQAPAAQTSPTTQAELRAALSREAATDRRFTLSQVRQIPEVRNLVAPVDIEAITFETGSAAINPDQARQLATLGQVIEEAITRNPREIFLIEGHTDAVGNASYNLALSDRRAESVALALSEYFRVPPENLIVQGYGEEYLKIPTLAAERANRRASVRRITDLLASTR